MKPKLRTYKLFKEIAEIEPYIACNLPRYQGALFALLRFGILPLSIETGRAQKKKLKKECVLSVQMVLKVKHILYVFVNIINSKEMNFLIKY